MAKKTPAGRVSTVGCVWVSLLWLVLAAGVLEYLRPRGGNCDVHFGLIWLELAGTAVLLLLLSVVSAILSQLAGRRRLLGLCIAFLPVAALTLMLADSVLPYPNERTLFARFVLEPVPASVDGLSVEGGFGLESYLTFRFRIGEADVVRILASHKFKQSGMTAPEMAHWGLDEPTKYVRSINPRESAALIVDRSRTKAVYSWSRD